MSVPWENSCVCLFVELFVSVTLIDNFPLESFTTFTKLIKFFLDNQLYFFQSNFIKWLSKWYCVTKMCRARLEYAYLPFNKFIRSRIDLINQKMHNILTSFSVTESSCDDTSRVKRIKSMTLFKRNMQKKLSWFLIQFLVCSVKVTLTCNDLYIFWLRL